MRWNSKPSPKEYTSKWIKRFAWLPIKMGSGYLQYHEGPWIWLETYYSRLTWMNQDGWPGWHHIGGPTYSVDPLSEYSTDSSPERHHYPQTDVSAAIERCKNLSILADLALSPREDVRIAAQDRLRILNKKRKKK